MSRNVIAGPIPEPAYSIPANKGTIVHEQTVKNGANNAPIVYPAILLLLAYLVITSFGKNS